MSSGNIFNLNGCFRFRIGALSFGAGSVGVVAEEDDSLFCSAWSGLLFYAVAFLFFLNKEMILDPRLVEVEVGLLSFAGSRSRGFQGARAENIAHGISH